MRIRTRIIWISCGAILAASLLGDAIIWILAGRSFRDEAFIRAYQKTYVFAENFERAIGDDPERAGNDSYLSYYFKAQNDDYNICIRAGEEAAEEVYNHTIFDAAKLAELSYRSVEASSMEQAYLTWEGKQYVVFCRDMPGNLIYYRIEDISDVGERMEWLAVCMLAITLAVTAAAVLVASVILKRVMRPLQELNDTTKYIAQGRYDQRLKIRRPDEIGQLGESFNRMAEAVEARTRSLEESERKKTLFMGNLTHELKTPMTAISGYAQTLLSTKLGEEDRQEALMYIYEECSRLERLSRKMMKLLELDQDDGLELTETPVLQIFDAAARSCGAILKEKQIDLQFSQHGERFPMDADLMTDVLINLIDNAVKASGQGGRIVLKAYGNCIEVQDFGRGIPAGEQERILEPFYMVDKSRSRKSGGAGLGLALTALIAKRHNIALKIDSEPGKGTRMILQFV